MRTGGRLMVTAAALAVLGLASGCGGGSPSAAPADSEADVAADGPTTAPPPTPEPGSYDMAGRDAGAVCAQLKVIAENWDRTPGAGEDPAVVVPRILAAEGAAAEKLQTLAPAGLATDVAVQVDAARAMTAQYLPSASVAPPTTTSGPARDLRAVGQGQTRIEQFATGTCGFSVFPQGKGAAAPGTTR